MKSNGMRYRLEKISQGHLELRRSWVPPGFEPVVAVFLVNTADDIVRFGQNVRDVQQLDQVALDDEDTVFGGVGCDSRVKDPVIVACEAVPAANYNIVVPRYWVVGPNDDVVVLYQISFYLPKQFIYDFGCIVEIFPLLGGDHLQNALLKRLKECETSFIIVFLKITLKSF